jgi:halimadienyl-diphosphate synthase
MALLDELPAFLAQVGSSKQGSTAYDTAWVGALSAPDQARPRFPQALEWINTHQHPDGSWGAPAPYYHDRILSTLCAVLTVQGWGRRAADRDRVERGLNYIWRNAHRLPHDPAETVGFELILPTLLDAAAARGLRLPQSAFAQTHARRAEKLARVPLDLMYNRGTPLPINLESLGASFVPARAGGVQEANGSDGSSPAATAFLLQHTDNPAAAAYLTQCLREAAGDGGVPTYFPFETMEASWVLLPLQYARPDLYQLPGLHASLRPLLDSLYATQTVRGWGASRFVTLQEVDDTAVAYTVLRQAGYEVDPDLLFYYEEPTHFRCYPFELDASISAQAHVLSALHFAGLRRYAAQVAKILAFLRRTQTPDGFWFDKWHLSPYYTTSRTILAAADLAPDLVCPALEWICRTQWQDGGWGYYSPTLEETAFCVLALTIAKAQGLPSDSAVLDRGRDYLVQRFSPQATEYPPLWIGKVLYAPVQMIRGSIFAALLAGETY